MDKGKTMAYSHFVSILMYHLVYLCSFSQLHNITKNSGYNRKYFYIKVQTSETESGFENKIEDDAFLKSTYLKVSEK